METPHAHVVKRNIPPPLDAIGDACTHSDPLKRPRLSLEKLDIMAARIKICCTICLGF